MTTPAPPRIQPATARVKMTLGGSIGGAPWQAAFWFTSDGTGTKSPTDMTTDAAAAFALSGTAVKTAFNVVNHTSTQWQTLKLDYYPGGSAAVLVTGTKTAIASSGLSSTASAASQCIVITSLSAIAGRSGKGRTFLPHTSSINGGGQPFEINTAPAFLGCGKLQAAVLSLTKGQMNLTRSLRCDTRPDRQEHREKRLVFGTVGRIVGAG